jgi:hypothetical protein
MTRNDLLGEITGLAGQVFRDLEAKGITFSQRQVLMFNEAFCKAWLALPEPVVRDALADAVLDDERNHGGLLSRETLQKAHVTRYGVPSDYMDV